MSHTMSKADLIEWRREVRLSHQGATANLKQAEYHVARLNAQLAWLDAEIEKKRAA